MSTMTIRKSPLFRFIALTVLIAFAGLLPAQPSYAQVAIIMPPPGQMIHVTRHFEPPQMVGLQVDLKDPFSFNFIMDQGEKPMSDDVKKEEFNKIIKYFLVSLAMPNRDMWVNLSPYESQHIIPAVFAQTEMGRDLLAQDYILKQFTASLMYPEEGLGKKFWDKVYSQAQERFGTTEINVNTFNKVWIVADHADVYQKDDTAFLVASHLKVMLEQDYMAIEKNKEMFGSPEAVNMMDETRDAKTKMASQVVREIIIPAIEKEVNEGQEFAAVRQVYNAEIMATWFKKTLRQSLLGQVFANKSKIAGQRVSDPQAMEKIYKQYLRAYKKGVFNYIREDATPDGQTIPRKYFSGGAIGVSPAMVSTITPAMVASSPAAQQEVGRFARVMNRIKNSSRLLLAAVGFASLTGLPILNPAAHAQVPGEIGNQPAPAVQAAEQRNLVREGMDDLGNGIKDVGKGSLEIVGGTAQDTGKLFLGIGRGGLRPVIWVGKEGGQGVQLLYKVGGQAVNFTVEQGSQGLRFVEAGTGRAVHFFEDDSGRVIATTARHEARAVSDLGRDLGSAGKALGNLVGPNLYTLPKEVDDLRAERDGFQDRVNTLQAQLDAAKNANEETKKGLGDQLAKAQADLQAKQDELDRRERDYIKHLAAVKKAAENMRTGLQNTISGLQSENARLGQEMQGLDRANAEQAGKIKDLEDQVAANNAKITDLNKASQDLEGRITVLGNRLQGAQGTIEALKSKVKQLKGERDRNRNIAIILALLTAGGLAAAGYRVRTGKDLGTVITEKSESDAKVSALENDVDKLKKQAGEDQVQIQAANEGLRTSQTEVERLATAATEGLNPDEQAAIQETERVVRAAGETAAPASSIEDLQAQMDALKDQLTRQRAALRREKGKLAKAKISTKTAEEAPVGFNRNHPLEKKWDVEELRAKEVPLQANVDNLTNAVAGLQGQIRDLEDQIQKVIAEAPLGSPLYSVNIQNKIKALNRELRQTRGTLAEVKKELATAQLATKTAEEAPVGFNRNHPLEKKWQVEELRAAEVPLKADVDDYTHAVATLQSIIQGLEGAKGKNDRSVIDTHIDAVRNNVQSELTGLEQIRESLERALSTANDQDRDHLTAEAINKANGKGQEHLDKDAYSIYEKRSQNPGFDHLRFFDEQTGVNSLRGEMTQIDGYDHGAKVAEIEDQIRARVARNLSPNGLRARLNEERAKIAQLADFVRTRSAGNGRNNVGGINLSDANLTMNIKVDGAGMPLPAQFQDKSLMNLKGLTSIIRRITPLTPENVPALYELLK